jgi:hypothetical protein
MPADMDDLVRTGILAAVLSGGIVSDGAETAAISWLGESARAGSG